MKGRASRREPWKTREFARSPFLWAALLGALTILVPAAARGTDPLQKGNEAFATGDYVEAARIYESEEEGGSLLTRRFNAGVSHVKAGSLDDALARFEEVSVKADGTLRKDAVYNAGHVRFQGGKAFLQEATKAEDREAKLKQLMEAAKAYRAASEFFRQVDPPDEDTEYNIAVSKTALRAVLDQIARIEEEKRKEAEDEALKDPPELLRQLVAKEKIHRTMARALAGQPGGKVRLGARRLRKSVADNRRLAQKLQHHLTKEPAAPPPNPATPGAPTPPAESEEEKARKAQAAEAIGAAIKAQESAEITLQNLEVAGAVPHHTQAIVELRKAMLAFPINLPAVIGEAVATQEAIRGTLEKIGQVERVGLPKKIKGSGAGKVLVETIKDKVLMPLAKLVSPERTEDARALADEEDDVLWGSQIVAQAKIPPSPEPQGQAQLPPGARPPQPQQPQLDAQQAEELSKALQKEGQTAVEASTKAKEHLAAGHAQPAAPEAQKALEALKRAAELLPKPPEPPEERLKKLIAKQEETRKATQGLSGLAEDLQHTAALQIVTGQRADGKEAASIAEELEKSQDEPPKKAAVKVREGEREVYASAEAIARKRSQEGEQAIGRDIEAFKEALAILSGKDPDQEEEQDQEKQQDQNQPGQEPQPEQNRYALSPGEARSLQGEMDRERREEESKIYIAPSSQAVEKDW